MRSAKAMARLAAAWTRPVALVPTMGALHAGHLALIAQARRVVGDQGLVVVSIFVNPLQFGPAEDLSRYPRPLRRDLAMCRVGGVDLVFHPGAAEMYEPGQSITVSETLLSAGLCGASRPGHFSGVCTVVAKLFNLVRPTVAVFGRKDYQQLAIIRRMARGPEFPRADRSGGKPCASPDGLALSSRNTYLQPDERAQAPVLRRRAAAHRRKSESRGAGCRAIARGHRQGNRRGVAGAGGLRGDRG